MPPGPLQPRDAHRRHRGGGRKWWANWYWSIGTSIATPHAAGIAALIISEGGKTKPALVEVEMMKRADLGAPGNDDHYGMGRVSSGY